METGNRKEQMEEEAASALSRAGIRGDGDPWETMAVGMSGVVDRAGSPRL